MSARTDDINGYTVIKDNNLSKTGVYPYLGSQLPDADDPNKVYYVYRPASTLQKSVDSMKSIPWINDHKMLGSGYNDKNSTADGIVTDNVRFEDPYLKGDLKIFNANLKGLIDDGKKDLSLGYRATYKKESGVFNGQQYDYIQTSMLGNHLASVQEGRTGKDVSVQDAMCDIIADINHIITLDFKQEHLTMAIENERQNQPNVTLDEKQLNAIDSLVDVSNQLSANVQDMKDMFTAFMDEMKKQKDNMHYEKKDGKHAKDMEEEEDEDDPKKKKASMDESAVNEAITNGVNEKLAMFSKGAELAKSAESLVGTFDHSNKTETEVAEYLVKKLELTCDANDVGFVKGFIANSKEQSTVIVSEDSKDNSLSALDKY